MKYKMKWYDESFSVNSEIIDQFGRNAGKKGAIIAFQFYFLYCAQKFPMSLGFWKIFKEKYDYYSLNQNILFVKKYSKKCSYISPL